MIKRPLRVGLVGMGSAAELFHLPAIASKPEHVELVRVSDPSQERLDRARELTGLAESQVHVDTR